MIFITLKKEEEKRLLINEVDIRNFLQKTFLFFNLKDFIFYKYICKMQYFGGYEKKL